MFTEFVRVKASDLEELFEKIGRLQEIIKCRDDEVKHLKEERADLTKELAMSQSIAKEFSRMVERKNATIKSLRDAPSVEVPFFDIKMYA